MDRRRRRNFVGCWKRYSGFNKSVEALAEQEVGVICHAIVGCGRRLAEFAGRLTGVSVLGRLVMG